MARVVASFDSVVLAAITRDVEALIGGRVVRAVQPAIDEVVLDIRKDRHTESLLCSIHARWARAHLAPPQENAGLSPFAQMLRRRLDRALLTGVDLPLFERTLTLRFETEEGHADLAIEIMGRHSNIILIQGGIISGSLKPVPPSKSSVRTVLPGRPYTPPPRDRPTPADLTEERLQALLATSDPLASRLVATVLGISPLMARELSVCAGLDPDASAAAQHDTAPKLWPHLRALTAAVRARRFEPVLYRDGTEPVGYAPFPLIHIQGPRVEPVARMSDAVAAVAARWMKPLQLDDARTALLAAIEAALKRARRTEEDLRRALAEAEQGQMWRERGELLLAYAAQVPAGAAEVTLPGYDGTPVVIPIEPDLTAVENAQRIFRRYGKLRSARTSLAARLRQVEAERAYLESVRALANQATSPNDLLDLRGELSDQGDLRARVRRSGDGARRVGTKRSRAAGPRTFHLPSGDTVLVGRTNYENDTVTFEIAGPDDLWFHARGVAGAHTILKSGSRRPAAQAIQQAAAIAAYFSSARTSGSVAVDYTERKYVRKPRGSRPGFVVYARERTIHVKPEIPSEVY